MSNTLEYVLKLSSGAFTGPLAKARNEQGRFISEGKQIAGTAKEVGNLGSAFGGLTTKILAAFTAWKAGTALFSGVAKSLNMAAEMESTNVAFKTLVGNAVKAADVLGKIKRLGAETPFEFPELANAGRMLISFGESSDTVTDTLRRIGDVASGVQAPIGEIAEIYGKARTQGTLFAEDINQLTGRGIPIIGQFARILNVSEGAVKDLASEGKITFPLLDQAFRNLTAQGGQFFGMMSEQSTTTKGLWSTLTDTVNELYLTLGQPLNDALKPMLTDAIGLAQSLQPMVASIGTNAGLVVTAVRDFVSNIGSGTGAFDQLLASMGKALGGLGEIVAVPLNAIKAGIEPLGKALMMMIEPIGPWLTLKFEQVALGFAAALTKYMAPAIEAVVPVLGKGIAEQLAAVSKAYEIIGSVKGAQADEASKQIRPGMDAGMQSVGGVVSKMNNDIKAGIESIVGNAKGKAESAAASKVVKEGRKTSRESVGLDDSMEFVPAPKGFIGSGTYRKRKLTAEQEKAKKDDELFKGQADKAPGADAAIAATTTTKPAVKPSDPFNSIKIPAAKAREATNAAFATMGTQPESGSDDTASNGRKRIISKRDGTTKAKTREQDSLYKPFGTPGFDSLYGGKIPNVKLTAPGTAKRQDTERRETAATQSRAGSGGGDKPRWEVVVQIEKHLANLTVV